VRDRQKLESHSVNCPALNKEYEKAFRSVWLGPAQFIKWQRRDRHSYDIYLASFFSISVFRPSGKI